MVGGSKVFNLPSQRQEQECDDRGVACIQENILPLT